VLQGQRERGAGLQDQGEAHGVVRRPPRRGRRRLDQGWTDVVPVQRGDEVLLA
jgi:hypothetical protein